ncbi:PH domain-containing protein [Streptosporangium amethystogenes]|uniref:PH domain-containing protein n=1 Tax=Streptosporangium amethystogenes TaxID=2002 RepID=UPI0004C6BA65|nr:PH domain-containing protein [Streptosporangium amethystogenes]
MSPESVSPPPLPVVWRPKNGRIVAYGFACVITLGAILMAVFLPAPFTLADRIGMLLLGLLIAWALHLLGRCRVEADERGITVVNPLRSRRYEWAEVLGVTLTDHEPWAKIDFADGITVGAMGLQGSEKKRTMRQVRELAALIRERGEADEAR